MPIISVRDNQNKWKTKEKGETQMKTHKRETQKINKEEKNKGVMQAIVKGPELYDFAVHLR